MKISIIIVSWNSEPELSHCINSLLEHVNSSAFEILVIDNDSEDKTSLDQLTNHPHVKVIKNPSNLGFSKACNIGIQKAEGEFCLILNPDIIFQSNPLPKLLSLMEQDPSIGVIAPLLVNEQGKPQIEGYYYTFPSFLQFLFTRTLLTAFTYSKNLVLRHYHSAIPLSGIHFIDQIPGAFLLFKKDLMAPHKTMNEAFFIWMEDVDFCKRIANAGKKVAVCADESVTHIGGSSFQSWSEPKKYLMYLESYQTYIKMHEHYFIYTLELLILIISLSVTIVYVTLKNWIFSSKKSDAQHYYKAIRHTYKNLFRYKQFD